MPAKRTYADLVGNRWVDLDNYYSKLITDAQTGCELWTGVQSSIGYGFIGFRDAITDKRGMMTAHRLALMQKLDREIAPGMNANHTCHNKLCCNPDHLYEGTQQQKIADMVADGINAGRAPGQLVGPYLHKQHARTYRYSEEEINWVRNAPAAEIATRYGISHKRASTMKGAFRSGYRWLPYEKVNLVRGRRAKKLDKPE